MILPASEKFFCQLPYLWPPRMTLKYNVTADFLSVTALPEVVLAEYLLDLFGVVFR